MALFDNLSRRTRELLEQRRQRREERQQTRLLRKEEQRLVGEQEQTQESLQTGAFNTFNDLETQSFATPLTGELPLPPATTAATAAERLNISPQALGSDLPEVPAKKPRKERRIERLVEEFGGLTGPVRSPEQLDEAFQRQIGGSPVGLFERAEAGRILTPREQLAQRLRDQGVDVESLETFTPAEDLAPQTPREAQLTQQRRDAGLLSRTATEAIATGSDIVRDVAGQIVTQAPGFIAREAVEGSRDIGLNFKELFSKDQATRRQARRNISGGFTKVGIGALALAKEVGADFSRTGESVIQAVYKPLLGERIFEEAINSTNLAQNNTFGRDLEPFQITGDLVYDRTQDIGFTPFESLLAAGLATGGDIALTAPVTLPKGKSALKKAIQAQMDRIVAASDVDAVRAVLKDIAGLPDETIEFIAEDLVGAKTAKEVNGVIAENAPFLNRGPKEIAEILAREEAALSKGLKESREQAIIRQAAEAAENRVDDVVEVQTKRAVDEIDDTVAKGIAKRTDDVADLTKRFPGSSKIAIEVPPSARTLIPESLEQVGLVNAQKERIVQPDFVKDTGRAIPDQRTPEQISETLKETFSPEIAEQAEKTLQDLGDFSPSTGIFSKLENAAKDSGFLTGFKTILTDVRASLVPTLKDKNINVTDTTNPVNAMDKQLGKQQFADQVNEQIQRDLLTGMRAYAKNNGFTFEEVYDSVQEYAKDVHSLDFNKQKVQERIEALKKTKEFGDADIDAIEQEIADLYQDLDRKNFAGKTREQAQIDIDAFKAKYGDSPTLERYRKLLVDVNNYALDIDVNSGLISRETYNFLRKVYPDYVPLFRELGDENPVVKTLKSLIPNPLKRAKGSSRQVTDVIQNSFWNLGQSSARAYDNAGKRSLAQYVRDNPNNEKVKQVFDGVYSGDKRSNVLFAISQTDDPAVKKALTDTLEDIDKLSANEEFFYENGKKMILRFKNPLEKSKVMGTLGQGIINNPYSQAILWAPKGITRFFGSMFTRYSPDFWLPNKIRDLTDAFLVGSSQVKNTLEFQKNFIKNSGKAHRIALKAARGVKDAETKIFNEFFKEKGGTIGGQAMQTIENSRITQKELFDRERSIVSRNAYKLPEAVDNINQYMEDSSRFLTFLAARESGYSIEAANYLAKTSSVNFNRKGAVGPLMNTLYLFFNASVQGTENMTKILQDPLVATQVTGVMSAATWAQEVWNSKVDEDWKKNIPDFVRARNLVFVTGISKKGNIQYIKIPIPYSLVPLNTFLSGVGDIAEGNKSLKRAVLETAKTTLETANPVESGTLSQTIAPTFLDIPVQLKEGKNAFGNDLIPALPSGTRADEILWNPEKFGENIPERTALAFSKFLYDNANKSVSPEYMMHVYEQVLSGGLKNLRQTGQLLLDVKNKRPIDVSQIVGLNDFAGVVTPEQQARAQKRTIYDDFEDKFKDLTVKDKKNLEPWLRQYLIDNAEELKKENIKFSNLKRAMEFRDINLPSLGTDFKSTKNEGGYKMMTTLTDMLESNDPQQVEQANKYLGSLDKEGQDAFIRWQAVTSVALSPDTATAEKQYVEFLEREGVDVKRKNSGELYSNEKKKFEKFRAASIRQSKQIVPFYDTMYEYLDKMEEGERLTPVQTNALVKMADKLVVEGGMAGEEYSSFILQYFVAKEMPDVVELSELAKSGTVDFDSVIAPRLRELGGNDKKLNKELRKRYTELTSLRDDFSGAVVGPQ